MPMTDKIRDAVLKVRNKGKTNMFDLPAVQRIVYEMERYESVLWLEDHRDKYIKFILT
jgi:hypothetical protein